MTQAWAFESDCYEAVVAELQCDKRDCQRILHEAMVMGPLRLGYEETPTSIEDLKDRGLAKYYPDDGVWSFSYGVQISRASLAQWLQSQQAPIIDGAKKGRKATYDWDAAWAFTCAAVHNDGVPETQAELVRKIQDWFSLRDQEPADSEIKRRVSMVYSALGR